MSSAEFAVNPEGSPGNRKMFFVRASGFGLVILLLVLWETSVGLGWVASANWPPVSSIISAMGQGLWSGELFENSLLTLYRMAVGFVIGVTCGIAVGVLMANFRAIDALLEPLVELCRPMPIPAIVPPLILFLGIGDALKIFVVAFAVFFPVAVNTVHGVKSVPLALLETARTLQRNRTATIIRVVLPAALPYITAGMRIALATALIVTIVAEMIAGSSGLGYYLLTIQYAMRPADMYGAIFLLGVIGYGLNGLFVTLERRLLPWFHDNSTA